MNQPVFASGQKIWVRVKYFSDWVKKFRPILPCLDFFLSQYVRPSLWILDHANELSLGQKQVNQNEL